MSRPSSGLINHSFQIDSFHLLCSRRHFHFFKNIFKWHLISQQHRKHLDWYPPPPVKSHRWDSRNVAPSHICQMRDMSPTSEYGVTRYRWSSCTQQFVKPVVTHSTCFNAVKCSNFKSTCATVQPLVNNQVLQVHAPKHQKSDPGQIAI